MISTINIINIVAGCAPISRWNPDYLPLIEFFPSKTRWKYLAPANFYYVYDLRLNLKYSKMTFWLSFRLKSNMWQILRRILYGINFQPHLHKMTWRLLDISSHALFQGKHWWYSADLLLVYVAFWWTYLKKSLFCSFL